MSDQRSGEEPAADDELLYRRVLVPHLVDGILTPQAFEPHRSADVTGLSIFRAKYKSLEDAARGPRPDKQYFVAVVRAGDLRAAGIEIASRPLPDDPGHAELPQLNSATRKDAVTIERMQGLARLSRIEGPFGPANSAESPAIPG